MKAFIVLACAAIAAARGVDYNTVQQNGVMNPTHYGRYSYGDVGYYGPGYKYVHDQDYNTEYYGKDNYYNKEYNGVSYLTMEQMYTHPHYQRYMNLPLFRQCMEQYPVMCKRYVESPMFQKYWTYPEYQMYWTNPMYYYKHIVPQIQRMTTKYYPTTYNYEQYGYGDATTGDYMNRNYNYGYDRSYNFPYGYSPYTHNYGKYGNNNPMYTYGRNYYGKQY